MRDLKRERMASAYFEEQSRFSPLTRLGNCALFNERGEMVVVNAQRVGAQVGVLLIDLDYSA